MSISFEWDADKAKTNRLKHRIGFEEASTVFGDPLSLTIHDPEHSREGEDRFVTVGHSERQRLIVVVHCDLGDRIRLISARSATSREKKNYEEGR